MTNENTIRTIRMNTALQGRKPFAERLADAEARASKWLADGNEYREAGKNERAEGCYEKAQFWLDRANKLRGFQ